MLLQMAGFLFLFLFFLWLNNNFLVPLCVYVSLCVCVCVYLPHFLYSFISGHLGCFHILVIVNNAVVQVVVQLSFWVSVFVSFSKYTKVGLLDHMVVYVKFFEEPSVLLSSPTNLHSYQQYTRAPFSAHLFQHLHLFDNRSSNRSEMMSHCGFDFHFHGGYWRWTPLHVPVGGCL